MTPLAAVGEQTVGAEVEAAGMHDSPGERRWQLDQGGTREGGRSGDGEGLFWTQRPQRCDST